MENTKVFKVWNNNRTEGRLLGASKFQELKTKVITKFELGEETGNIRLVLSDGCIIDDEDVFLQLESNELYVLKADEVLNIPQALSTASGGSEAGMPSSKSEQLSELVKRLRSKQSKQRPSKKQKSTSMTCHKVQLGWMLHTGTKFTQVRTSSGGGTRIVEMADASTYAEIKNRAIEIFFPNGSNIKGKKEDFDHHLGDFQGRSIPQDGFTLQIYINSMKACNMTVKPRLYLLSKMKDEENEDESWEFAEEVDVNPPISILNAPGVSTQNPQSPANLPSPAVSTPHQQESIQNDEENSWDLPDLQSPVVLRMPQVPTCTICTDRFCDTFFVPCGHIACAVCTAELEERGSQCHICRESFTSTSKLFY